MFKDYYLILGIKPPITGKELKTAYRKQCFEWHPDKNPDSDTTEMMQDIIEAYIFLKDDVGRERYDETYFKFKKYQRGKEFQASDTNQKESSQEKQYKYDYPHSDETLKKWMDNAKEQAKKMKLEVIDEFKGAVTESGKSIFNYFLYTFLPMIVGFLLFKSCSF